jgi:hypothetical protein
MVICWLLLTLISQEYVKAEAQGASYIQTLGALTLKVHDSINPILIIVFSLGALMLYYFFYRSNLIPRWISGWGFFAILLHLATGFLIMFHRMNPFSTINMVVNLPILLQEMVMAVWLIVKGFNRSPYTSGAVYTETHELMVAH